MLGAPVQARHGRTGKLSWESSGLLNRFPFATNRRKSLPLNLMCASVRSEASSCTCERSSGVPQSVPQSCSNIMGGSETREPHAA